MPLVVLVHDELQEWSETERTAALRTFFNIAVAWRLSLDEQARLLGLSDGIELHRWKCLGPAAIDPEMLQRISYVLGIFRAINTVIQDAGRADAWMWKPNAAPLFEGRSAMEVITSGKIDDLKAVRNYLAAQLG